MRPGRFNRSNFSLKPRAKARRPFRADHGRRHHRIAFHDERRGRRAHPAAAAVCVSHHGVRDVHVDPGHPGRLGVAVSEIQAGLSASSSEVSWVQTSYLIAEVIAIPLSGFLSRAFGTRLLFAISASGFTIASFFCGFASTIEQMILWRAIQGFLGAGMIPTVFASAYTVFPRSKFHIVGPIIGLVATLAPTIGPTVGGFITDMMSWHWLFFINIVPGIGITIGVLALVDFDQPNFALLEHFDWWGLLFMAGFLGTLEYVLEEGPAVAMAGRHLGRGLRGDLRGLGDRLLLARAQRAGADRRHQDLHRPQFRRRLPDLVLRRHRPLRPHLHVSALSRRSARLQRADDRRDHVRLWHRHVPHRADRGAADGEVRHALPDRDRSGAVRARLLPDDLDHQRI